MDTILIIEDNNDLRENIGEILSLGGYNVESAENGKIGVEKAIKCSPNLILCDIMMPELDGYGVLHILSNNPKTAGIPFLFLTAKAEMTDFRKGMTLGSDDYLTKPFDDIVLLETISKRLLKAKNKPEGFSKLTNSYNQDFDINQLITPLLEGVEERIYRKKDIIFEEGDNIRWIFWIMTGKVKLVKTNEDGRELILNIYDKNEILGQYAILEDDHQVHTAIAMEETRVQMIPSEKFRDFVHKNQDINKYFLKSLSLKIHEREQQMLALAFYSVRKRVATILYLLNLQEGNSINLLREDLASFAGTAKETLIRCLTDFKSEGIIDIQNNGIFVLHPDKLKNMPN
jgi:CRP/FNR family transcriptional regulator, polysaccharide utilization system transcription regulator